MSVTFSSGEKTTAVVFVPYSHMDEEDENLFYDTMAELLTYANRVLRLIDEPRISLRGNDDRLLGYGTVVSEELWQHRWIIDDFVRKNPLGVEREHLDTARPWRHAVHDVFTCIDANPDSTLYMNEHRAFAVGAMRGDADRHVHHIPSLMLLTLLPFKGGIVTDSKTLHLADTPQPWAIPHIAEQAKELVRAGVIATADELIAYERTHRGQHQISPVRQKQIDEYLDTLRPARSKKRR